MAALTPCVFVDQIFNCAMAMETPPPDAELVPFGEPPLVGPPPGLASPGVLQLEDVTKTDASFNMSTLVNTLDFTAVSSITSMVQEKDPDAEAFEPQRSILFGLKRATPPALLDAESAQYGAIFSAELPAVEFAPNPRAAKSGVVHERVRAFEEMCKTDIKSEPCSAVASPSPPPDPNRTPDPRVKIEERDEIASYYSPTAYMSPEFPLHAAVDYYNSDRHPMVDGNNSDEEDYSAAELDAHERYHHFVSEINAAISQGTLAHGSPALSGKLFVDEDSREPSSCSWHPDPGSPPLGSGALDSYEDHSWDLPAGILGDNEYADGCTNALMEECAKRAHHLHPKSLQQCSGSECASIALTKARERSRVSSLAVSLHAPTPLRPSSFSFFIAPSVGTVLHSEAAGAARGNDHGNGHGNDHGIEHGNDFPGNYHELSYEGYYQEPPSNQDAVHHPGGDGNFPTDNSNPNEGFSSAIPEKQNPFLDIWHLGEQAIYDGAWHTPIKFRSESSNIDIEVLDALRAETCDVSSAQISEFLDNCSAFTADVQGAPQAANLSQANWSRSASSGFSIYAQSFAAPIAEDGQPSLLQSLHLQPPIPDESPSQDGSPCIFSDIPRPTVDRVISYRNVPGAFLPGSESLGYLYEGMDDRRQNSSHLPACGPFQQEVPRTYPAEVDFYMSLLDTSDPHEPLSDPNNAHFCQEMLSAQFQEHSGELDFRSDCQTALNDFLAHLLPEPPAPIMKPKHAKASRVAPKRLENYRVSKNKAKTAGTQMSTAIEDNLYQAISSHLMAMETSSRQ